MKQFILGEFKDHTSCFGYQKKLAYVHLVEDGSEISDHNRVGYVKTEPLVAEDGSITGEIYYYRGGGFPRHQPRYFATSRALIGFMQANLSIVEKQVEEADEDFDELSDMLHGTDEEEDTIH
jgi:hypothetical protein